MLGLIFKEQRLKPKPVGVLVRLQGDEANWEKRTERRDLLSIKLENEMETEQIKKKIYRIFRINAYDEKSLLQNIFHAT